MEVYMGSPLWKFDSGLFLPTTFVKQSQKFAGQLALLTSMSTKRKGTLNKGVKVKCKKSDGESSAQKKRMETMYGMKMPEDLYEFWRFCQTMNTSQPLDALSLLDLKLVGPLYYLHNPVQGSLKDPFHYHIKWRFYYDTPELLTVITSDKPNADPFHMGYFSDDPKSINTSIVVSNDGKDAKLNIVGDNLFAGVSIALKKILKGQRKDKSDLLKFQKSLEEFATELRYSLDAKSLNLKSREKKVVTKSFTGAGLVVPIVKDVGYRPLHYNDGDLKRLFKKVVDAKNDEERLKAFEPIQEMVNFVQFANDECDYGMGFELGIDLFCYGSRYFHKLSKMLLTTAYKLLKRDLYASICENHIEDRRKENTERL